MFRLRGLLSPNQTEGDSHLALPIIVGLTIHAVMTETAISAEAAVADSPIVLAHRLVSLADVASSEILAKFANSVIQVALIKRGFTSRRVCKLVVRLNDPLRDAHAGLPNRVRYLVSKRSVVANSNVIVLGLFDERTGILNKIADVRYQLC